MNYLPDDLVLLATRYREYIDRHEYEDAARVCALLHRITGRTEYLPHTTN